MCNALSTGVNVYTSIVKLRVLLIGRCSIKRVITFIIYSDTKYQMVCRSTHALQFIKKHLYTIRAGVAGDNDSRIN